LSSPPGILLSGAPAIDAPEVYSDETMSRISAGMSAAVLIINQNIHLVAEGFNLMPRIPQFAKPRR
jgi:hypothetical protein